MRSIAWCICVRDGCVRTISGYNISLHHSSD